MVAINKPEGLLVHRSAIDRKTVDVAMTILRNQLHQWVYPVHRLDRPTSGVLLFSLGKSIARKLSLQFYEKSIQKTYLAVVRGYTEKAGVIDYPLKEKLDKKTDKKANPDKAKQDAVTRYRRLGTVELPLQVGPHPTSRYSLIQLNPETGRRHQLRRHLHHLHHPIIGDTNYGDSKHNRLFREHFSAHRLFLSAVQLIVNHPVSGQRIILNAPLDPVFKQVIKQFGWKSLIPTPWLGDSEWKR